MPKSLIRELFFTILLSVLILFSIPPAKAATPMISVGPSHACAVSETGTVQCWGLNNKGQLGNGTTQDSITPVTVMGIDNAVSVSVDDLDSCAMLLDGKVKCWGDNARSQLGVSSASTFIKVITGGFFGIEIISYSTTPVVANGITDAITVKVISGNPCAAFSTGEVKCLGGYNGNETISINKVVGINNAVSITGNSLHNCALLRTGEVRCWNENGYYAYFGGTATPVEGIRNAIAIAMEERRYDPTISDYIMRDKTTICAVLQTGQVQCWESYANTTKNLTYTTPTTVNGINDAIDITAGSSHFCVLLKNHTVQCWGNNYLGKLGNMSWDSSETPVTVLDINNAISISARSNHTCALLKTGEIRCWGDNAQNIRGNTNATQEYPFRSMPITVKGITNAKSIAIGSAASCATLQTGEFRCWGGDIDGYIHYGSNPVPINGITNPVSIAIGSTNMCVVIQSGEVKCWGSNFYGELGDGTNTNSKIPVTVKGISDAISVKQKDGYSFCATLRNGGVRCWGEGQDINKLLDAIPYLYPLLSDIPLCKIFDGGKVQCWGNNYLGQLGNGQTNYVYRDAPVTVIGINNAIAISGNGSRNCALLSTGSIQCWGDDTNGALGAGALSYLASSTVMGAGGVGYLNLFAFSQNVDKVFTWAENRLPQFKPSGVSQSMLGYRYRGYQDRYYLAVNEGGTPHVYYFDNTSMDSLMDVGLLSDFLNLVGN